ncbi:glycosyltransferase family 2 protein [Exiguobacterium artemiae]|uniref:glycosyltransferase family 2 protein n=1 Tax=Exiguobacterium artemiae TaxID=340145 RepID=UPI00296455E3|nr:glycosyltransferase [Exiguobacterium sibiricum]MDW2886474.1 glycosyltransferase [Exiguobacterium sibiricum]
MNIILNVIMSIFWLLLLYYSYLTVAGILDRYSKKKPVKLVHYPTVAVLIPAYNEGIVIRQTLEAMMAIEYPGDLDVFLLDDQSQDDTRSIALEFTTMFSRMHYVKVPKGDPIGKSRVLNYGLSITDSEYFLIFDADNQPKPDTVTRLVEQAHSTKNACGAVGVVKTINATTNMLTRMIAIEFQVFQLIMQSGRWKAFKTGSLAGTNMLLRRDVIENIGGYDPYALAEDAELTMRITALGYTLPVVYEAETWEQEPETMKVYMKQRTRWMLGNIYLLEKSIRTWEFWKGRTLVHSLQHIMTYLLFIFLLLISDIVLVLGLFGYAFDQATTPLILFWFMTYLVYTIQILAAQELEKTATPSNVFVGLIMYFTYAQLFVILLFRGIFAYIKSKMRKEVIVWDKTKRVKVET